jgi:inositol-pentakisphosphate 2-kinase
VNADAEQRKRAVYTITTDPRLRQYLLEQAQPLLHQLRASQVDLDVHGVLKTTPDTIFQLCKAMTLRDCTFFLRRSGDTVEARLGDLDLKQPERFTRWKTVEMKLIDGGWYTNTEHADHWKPEKICVLSRG